MPWCLMLSYDRDVKGLGILQGIGYKGDLSVL